MACAPFLDRARLREHRLAVGIVGGVVAVGLLTASILPSMAAADVSPSPTSASPTSPSPTSATAAPGTDGVAADVAALVRTRPKKPKAASATHKAKNIPDFPRDHKHRGKRIVYDKALMTVWLINNKDQVVARYPVVGRFDRPAKGVYRVFSKSPIAYNPISKVTFNHMVRFTYGPDTKSPIGLHAIPRYYDGKPMHSVKQLGLAIARGGCVRLSEKAAARVYAFAKVGDRVVVLPSP